MFVQGQQVLLLLDMTYHSEENKAAIVHVKVLDTVVLKLKKWQRREERKNFWIEFGTTWENNGQSLRITYDQTRALQNMGGTLSKKYNERTGMQKGNFGDASEKIIIL